MRRNVFRRVVGLVLLALWQAVVAAGTQAQPLPSIALFPSSGSGGTSVTVRGSGFTAGDTVLVDILGPSQDGESGTLATANVGQDGSFTTTVTIPSGGPPEQITLMAYPRSFGPRSRETVNRAPKATFAVIVAGPSPSPTTAPTRPPIPNPDSVTGSATLPRTGVGRVADSTSAASVLAAAHLLGLIVAAGLMAGAWHRPQALSK